MATLSSAVPSRRASAHSDGAFATFVRENALSLALAALFLAATAAQIGFGLGAYNEDRARDGRAAIDLLSYLTSGHFLEALFENWESEFLQMGIFVVLSVKLRQKGSAESKSLDEPSQSDQDPREHAHERGVPWPVRQGGIVLVLYENSLAIAFTALFLLSFAGHAYGGFLKANDDNIARGLPPETFAEYCKSSQFWFESFQNWQSEFLAVFAIVVLTIFLRQRGSPQSKAVAAPHSETGV
jgi:hypothetical protein